MRRSRSRLASRALVALLIPLFAAGVYGTVKKFSTSKASNSASLGGKTAAPVKPLLVSAPVASSSEVAKEEPPIAVVKNTPATAPVVKSEPVRVDSLRAEPPSFVRDPISEGRRKFEAGELVEARTVLNDALVAGTLGTGEAAARELLSRISEQLVFSPRLFKGDPYAIGYTVQSGDRLTKVAFNNAVTWELIARINAISDPTKVRALRTIKIVKGPFHAVVTKSRFTLDVYLGAAGGPGSMFVTSFSVGLGKNDSTPTGLWHAARKLKNPTYYSPRGEGIIAADDPKNPLGEYWIGLSGVDGQAKDKSSYGIHGTIEPDSIGREASMGCIRLRNEDVARVYELMVEEKSTVVVRD